MASSLSSVSGSAAAPQYVEAESYKGIIGVPRGRAINKVVSDILYFQKERLVVWKEGPARVTQGGRTWEEEGRLCGAFHSDGRPGFAEAERMKRDYCKSQHFHSPEEALRDSGYQKVLEEAEKLAPKQVQIPQDLVGTLSEELGKGKLPVFFEECQRKARIDGLAREVFAAQI